MKPKTPTDAENSVVLNDVNTAGKEDTKELSLPTEETLKVKSVDENLKELSYDRGKIVNSEDPKLDEVVAEFSGKLSNNGDGSQFSPSSKKDLNERDKVCEFKTDDNKKENEGFVGSMMDPSNSFETFLFGDVPVELSDTMYQDVENGDLKAKDDYRVKNDVQIVGNNFYPDGFSEVDAVHDAHIYSSQKRYGKQISDSQRKVSNDCEETLKIFSDIQRAVESESELQLPQSDNKFFLECTRNCGSYCICSSLVSDGETSSLSQNHTLAVRGPSGMNERSIKSKAQRNIFPEVKMVNSSNHEVDAKKQLVIINNLNKLQKKSKKEIGFSKVAKNTHAADKLVSFNCETNIKTYMKDNLLMCKTADCGKKLRASAESPKVTRISKQSLTANEATDFNSGKKDKGIVRGTVFINETAEIGNKIINSRSCKISKDAIPVINKPGGSFKTGKQESVVQAPSVGATGKLNNPKALSDKHSKSNAFLKEACTKKDKTASIMSCSVDLIDIFKDNSNFKDQQRSKNGIIISYSNGTHNDSDIKSTNKVSSLKNLIPIKASKPREPFANPKVTILGEPSQAHGQIKQDSYSNDTDISDIRPSLSANDKKENTSKSSVKTDEINQNLTELKRPKRNSFFKDKTFGIVSELTDESVSSASEDFEEEEEVEYFLNSNMPKKDETKMKRKSMKEQVSRNNKTQGVVRSNASKAKKVSPKGNYFSKDRTPKVVNKLSSSSSDEECKNKEEKLESFLSNILKTDEAKTGDKRKSRRKEVSGSNKAQEAVRNRISKSKVPLPRRKSICKEMTPRIVNELTDESSDTSDGCKGKNDEYVLNSDMPVHKKPSSNNLNSSVVSKGSYNSNQSSTSNFMRLFDKIAEKGSKESKTRISSPIQLNLIQGLIGQDKRILNPFERSKVSSPPKNSVCQNVISKMSSGQAVTENESVDKKLFGVSKGSKQKKEHESVTKKPKVIRDLLSLNKVESEKKTNKKSMLPNTSDEDEMNELLPQVKKTAERKKSLVGVITKSKASNSASVEPGSSQLSNNINSPKKKAQQKLLLENSSDMSPRKKVNLNSLPSAMSCNVKKTALDKTHCEENITDNPTAKRKSVHFDSGKNEITDEPLSKRRKTAQATTDKLVAESKVNLTAMKKLKDSMLSNKANDKCSEAANSEISKNNVKVLPNVVAIEVRRSSRNIIKKSEMLNNDKNIKSPVKSSASPKRGVRAPALEQSADDFTPAKRQRRCVSEKDVSAKKSGQQQRTKRAGSLDPVCLSKLETRSPSNKSPDKKGGRKPSLLQSPNKSGPLRNSECPEVSPQSKRKEGRTYADPVSCIEFHSERKRGGSRKSKQESSKRKKKQDLTDKSLLRGAGEVNQNTRKHKQHLNNNMFQGPSLNDANQNPTMSSFVENNVGEANQTVNQNPESHLPQGPSISDVNQNHAFLSLSNDPMSSTYPGNVKIIDNEIYTIPQLGSNAKLVIDYASQTHYVGFPTGIRLSYQPISNSNQLHIQPQVQSLLPYSPQSALSSVYSPMSQSFTPAFPSQNFIFNQNMPSAISTPNVIPVVFTSQNSPVLTSSNVHPSLIPTFSSPNSTVMNNQSAQSSLNPNLISVFDSLNSPVVSNPSAQPLVNPSFLSNCQMASNMPPAAEMHHNKIHPVQRNNSPKRQQSVMNGNQTQTPSSSRQSFLGDGDGHPASGSNSQPFSGTSNRNKVIGSKSQRASLNGSQQPATSSNTQSFLGNSYQIQSTSSSTHIFSKNGSQYHTTVCTAPTFKGNADQSNDTASSIDWPEILRRRKTIIPEEVYEVCKDIFSGKDNAYTARDLFTDPSIMKALSRYVDICLDCSESVNYNFPESFEDSPLIQVLKDFVSYYACRICPKIRAIKSKSKIKSIFFSTLYAKCSFSVCDFLGEILPPMKKTLSVEDVLCSLSLVALLAAFCEYRRRRLL